MSVSVCASVRVGCVFVCLCCRMGVCVCLRVVGVQTCAPRWNYRIKEKIMINKQNNTEDTILQQSKAWAVEGVLQCACAVGDGVWSAYISRCPLAAETSSQLTRCKESRAA